MSRKKEPPVTDAATEIVNHIDRYTESSNFVCFFCAFETHIPEEIVSHLEKEHAFVFSDIAHTPLIPNYLDYWRIHTPPLVQVPNTPYQTIDPENHEEVNLKAVLHRMRLEKVMCEHEMERTEEHEMQCLFCNDQYKGTWHNYLQWLFETHQFNPGRPSNLVFIPEMIQFLRDELNANTCIFCKSVFPNQRKLKSHMRKKKHMRIPTDPIFDRFYMVNYLELDGQWEENDSDDDTDKNLTLEEAAADFSETEVNETVCMICDSTFCVPEDAIRHMKLHHSFNIYDVRKALDNNFYDSVRFVNYARYLKSKNKCFVCGEDVIGVYKDHIESHESKVPTCLKNIIGEDQLLIPFIDGDPMLTELEDDMD